MPRSRIGYQDTRFARRGAHRYPGRQLPRFARKAGAAREASEAPELDDQQQRQAALRWLLLRPRLRARPPQRRRRSQGAARRPHGRETNALLSLPRGCLCRTRPETRKAQKPGLRDPKQVHPPASARRQVHPLRSASGPLQGPHSSRPPDRRFRRRPTGSASATTGRSPPRTINNTLGSSPVGDHRRLPYRRPPRSRISRDKRGA